MQSVKMPTNNAQMHETMLRKYNPDNQPWWQIPDDGYLYDHLVHHLLGAGRSGELAALLTASPDWLEKRCRGNNCTSFLADVDQALKNLVDPQNADQLLELVQLHTARQVAYARQNAHNDTALKILVWLNRKDEALNHARWQATIEDQCRRLLTIHDALHAKGQPDDSLLDEAYTLTAAITDKIQQILVRIKVVKGYARSGQFATAETIARGFAESHNRADALRLIARELARAENDRAAEIFAAALAEVRAIDDAWTRAEELSETAYEMSKTEGDSFTALRSQAREVFLEAQQAIESLPADEQTVPLRELVYNMAWAGRWTEAEAAARHIQENLWLADALGELAETIAESDREYANALFVEIETVVRRIEDTFEFQVALRDLATNLARAGHERAPTLFAEAREAIKPAQEEYEDANTLEYGMVRALAYASMDSEILEFSESIEDPNQRAMALAAAVEILAEDEQFDAAERIANAISDDSWQATAFVSLGDNLAQTDQARATILFARAANAFGVATYNTRSDALRDLAEALAKYGDKHALSVFAQARVMIRNIPRLDERARWMGLLVSGVLESGTEQQAYRNLASEILAEAQAIIQDITDEWHRTREPLNLARCYAEKGFYSQAETMARFVEDNGGRAVALGHTAAALRQAHNTEQTATVVNEAITLARQIEDAGERSTVLNELSEVLAWAGFFTEAEALIRDITDPDDKAVALCELSEALTEGKQFTEALRIAQEIEDDYWRGWALGALAPDMAEAGLFAEAERAARTLPDNGWSPNSLRALTYYMAKAGYFPEAERVARSIQNAWRRATALGNLTAALIKDENSHATTILAEVLEMIPNIDDQWERAEIWRDLAEKLGEVDYEQLDSIFTKAITAAQEIVDPGWKRGALNDLASTLAGSGRYVEALAVAHAIEDSDVRLRALRDIAFYLVEKKRYAEALKVLGPLQPDEFIKIVACGASNADGIKPTLVAMGLREVLRILGWIFPDFRAVYEQVMASED
jgi:hypothetical protein